MAYITLMFCLALLPCPAAANTNDPNAQLTLANLPEFLVAYRQSLEPIDAAYTHLLEQRLPVRDESGKPVPRREIKDRRKTVTDLRQTAKRLATSPENLVLTFTLYDDTEKLGDHLYDLSEVAWDNDRQVIFTTGSPTVRIPDESACRSRKSEQ